MSYYFKDCFALRPDFEAVMTASSIDATPETWTWFYPHESFVEILRVVLLSLEGRSKPLWLTGSYGTGKSHASLVIQKLFNDDWSRVQGWLVKHNDRFSEAMRASLKRLRDDKVLVIYDIRTDGVDAQNQFLMRLQKGVQKSFGEYGYTLPLKGKLEDVLERVRQDGQHFFAKRDEMQESLAYLQPHIKDAEELAKTLTRAGAEPTPGLISDIMRVLEARDIFMSLTPDEYVDWVHKAMAANGLSKIVYIWDEFSSFVERNSNELKSLEQIAEASQQGKFFLTPVTHTTLEAYGKENVRKANDRFVFKQLEMPNETALKLAANVLQEKENFRDKWRIDKEQMWAAVRGVVENYIIHHESTLSVDDFKGVLPLHPTCAYLLKHLAVAIGSNQRSLFEFLNAEDFREFIEHGGPDVPGKQFLTSDQVWRHFIERADLGADKSLGEARAEFAQREKDLSEDEQRVFKAVLLYGLVEQMLGTGSPLLSVREENIIRNFEGDGQLHNAKAVLGTLAEKHCFTIVNGRCERFRSDVDSQDIAKRKEVLQNQFAKQVLEKTETELDRHLKGGNPGMRYSIRVSDAAGVVAGKIRNRDSFGPEGREIALYFALAKDQAEQSEIRGRCLDLAKHLADHRIVFVHIPSLHFCSSKSDAWDSFIDNVARLALAEGATSKKVFESAIEKALEEWHGAVKSASGLELIIPNPQGEPFRQNITWGAMKSWMVKYARETFESYTDDISEFNVSAMGNPGGLRNWALAGIRFDKASGASKTVTGIWRSKGIRDDEKWFDENPQHPLTKLRDKCKSRLDNTVGQGNDCSIRKLFIELRRPPFGLLQVPHTAMVLGFALKEWLSGRRQLQWTDKTISQPLDEGSLAEIIEAAVKSDGEIIKNEKLICRLSKAEKAFIAQIGGLLG